MPGKNSIAPTDQRRGERLIVSYAESISVENFGLLHLQKIARVSRGCFWVTCYLIGEENIGCRKRLPVMPFNTPAQMKGDNQPACGNIPCFGQITYYFHVFIVFQQSGVKLAGSVMRALVGVKQPLQVAGLTGFASD